MLRDSLTVLHVVSKARSATKPSKSWTLAAVMGATSGSSCGVLRPQQKVSDIENNVQVFIYTLEYII